MNSMTILSNSPVLMALGILMLVAIGMAIFMYVDTKNWQKRNMSTVGLSGNSGTPLGFYASTYDANKVEPKGRGQPYSGNDSIN